MSRRRLLAAAALVVAAGCGDGTPSSDPASPASSPAETAVVDPALGPRQIAVKGEVAVGARLVASVSPDLADAAIGWGWHRCIEVPACQTIEGAESPSYTPTADDAWQVLRVIAVAGGKAVETRVGPVVNRDAEPFEVEFDLDPSANGNRGLIVGPGPLRVVVDADCTVGVIGGVEPASVEGSMDVVPFEDTTPARHAVVGLESPGGQLIVALDGDCDTAQVRVAGQR